MLLLLFQDPGEKSYCFFISENRTISFFLFLACWNAHLQIISSPCYCQNLNKKQLDD